MELTPEQKAILAEETHCIKVLAGAGSGKTTTMASFVYNGIKQKQFKDKEVCFITFTRMAGQEIKNKIKNIAGSNLDVMTGTIHSAMFRFLIAANIERPRTSQLYDVMMEESVKFFLKTLEERNPKLVQVLQKYKVLVVDEFQDIDDNQFKFISLFKQLVPSLKIVAIGDLAQNIYRFRGTSNEFLRTRLQKEIVPDLKTYKLTTNFRSMKRILDTVNLVFHEEINNGHILPMYPSVTTKNGIKPKYYEYAINPTPGVGEYEQLTAETILPIIKRSKLESKSVVLLFPAIKCASCNIITALLREMSRKQGYKLDFHQISKEDTTCQTVPFTYNTKDENSPVQFSSFHAAKGLEWDVVFVIDVSDSMYDIRDNDEDTEGFIAEKTNLLYVGITRAAEELYLFANANMGGRHRLFASLGKNIHTIMDLTQWGEEDHSPKSEHSLKPIAVTDLVRHLPQYPELFSRIKRASQDIKIKQQTGQRMRYNRVYEAMKKRNREMAFGTFIDWKIKQILCTGQTRCFQDILLDTLEFFSGIGRFLSKKEAFEDYDTRVQKLKLDFEDIDICPETHIEQFVNTSRYIALHNGKYHGYIDALKQLVKQIEYKIRLAASKSNPTIKEQYIISQARDFFTKGNMGEIQGAYAPTSKYMGLPEGFSEFVDANNVTDIIVDTLNNVGASCDQLKGDVAVEYSGDRIIIGEIDLYTETLGGVITEIKCSNIICPQELRDTGNCKNLLQVLAYVAIGRHGTIKKPAKWAFLLNPLTSTYERYDLDTWSYEDSKEFMNCLKDLGKLV
jgi:hypothetical protein